jgi:hypothetical protein
MSFQALTWATEQNLPAMQKIVLLMMANRTSHETGLCYPSLDLLAKECGMTKRSMIEQIAKLEVGGFIAVIRSAAENGVKQVNRYRLNLAVKPDVGSESRSLVGSEPHSLRSEPRSLGGSEPHSLRSEPRSLGGSEPHSPKPVTIEPKKETTNVVSKKTDENRNGSRLQIETLPDDWREFCHDERPELNADRVFARFRDHWIAESGAKGRKLDWFATWRNWVRNEKWVSYGSRQQSGQQRKLSAVELVQQASRRYEDAAERRRGNEKIVGSSD